MSVIAPKFRLGYFLKAIFDNAFWILTLVTLAGIPAIQIALFLMPLPVIDGQLLTAYLAFTWLFNPTMQIPLIKALLYSDLFRIAAFPGFGFCSIDSCRNNFC